MSSLMVSVQWCLLSSHVGRHWSCAIITAPKAALKASVVPLCASLLIERAGHIGVDVIKE